MNNSMDYLGLNININNEYLYLDEEVMLKIDIKNKSNYIIENGLFRLVMNENILKVLDDKFSVCINNFMHLGNIDPGFKISLQIPLNVNQIPEDFLESIFCYINFHIVKDNQLMDFTYKSNPLDLKFISKVEYEDFNVNFSKEKYFIDEDIHLLLKIKNNTKYILENITIDNFICDNTFIVKNKISTTLNDNIKLINNIISINKLDVDESLSLIIPISIEDNIEMDIIKINPILSYLDKNLNKIEIKKDEVATIIKYNEILDNPNFTYELSKTSGFLDDIITHKIVIRNNTDLELMDLCLNNNFSNKLLFIENSLVVNDIYRVEENISNEIKLGNIDSSEELIITFKTQISLASNIEDMKFFLKYKINNRIINQESNSLDFEIFYPEFNELSFKKYQSKNLIKLNDIIDITIEACNVGISDAIDVIIQDELASGLEYLHSSLFINDKPFDANITVEGIHFKNISPNETLKINYKAKALDICTNEETKACIIYTSQNRLNNLRTYSNVTSLTISGARIGNNNIFVELSDYTAKIEDIVTYKLIIKNTGNICCENLKLNIPTNDSIEFVDDSLIIDNNEYKEFNIFNGLRLSKINPNQIIQISYQVKIIDFPKPNPICDLPQLEYSFMFENNLEKNTINATKYKLYVNNPILLVRDLSSTTNINNNDYFYKTCFYKDNLFFNLELQNKGNVPIENLYLKLNCLKDLDIDKNSIKINNKPYDNAENNLIKLPSLNVSQKIYVEFYAQCVKTKENEIDLSLKFEYTFKDLKTYIPCKLVKNVKEKIIMLNPDMEINKFILDKDLELNKDFTKNINIKNTGNVLLSDINLNLNENDFFKNCKKVVFVNGNYSSSNDDIYINQLDLNETVNIAIRYNVENLDEFQSLIPESDVIAKYTLNNEKEALTIKKYSNKLNINIKNYSLDIKDKTTNETLMLNTINKYIISLLNNGNVDCNSVNLKIELPKEVSYIDNSLCINGKNTFVSNLSSGINIEELQCNQLKNISFDFKINSLPYKNKLIFKSNAECKYITDSGCVNKCFKSEDTILNIENIALDIIKFASSEILQSKDTVEIQTIINNIGSVDILNLYLNDNQNKNLVFVENSVYIDGENFTELNPVKGIELPMLKSGENMLLAYSYEYVPTISSNKIVHFSNVNYSYNLNNYGEQRISTKSNVLYLEGALSTFKEFTMENEYELEDLEPDIGDIVEVVTNTMIEQYYDISSIKNTSIENDEITGKKVIIKGLVMNRVEYIINNQNTSLYMLERYQPFSIFINLPNDYDGEEIYFKPKCNSVFYKSMGTRKLFISSLISIEGSF